MNILQQFTNELHHNLNARLLDLTNNHPINPIDHVELSRLATVEKMHRYLRNLSNVTAEKHENQHPLASFENNYPAITKQLNADLNGDNNQYTGEIFTNWVMDSHNNINEITDPFEPFSLLDRFNDMLNEQLANPKSNEKASLENQSSDDYIDTLLQKLDNDTQNNCQ